MKTPGAAKSFPGAKPYQQLAARALPWLVLQAQREKEITYGDLARLLGMPNPRNLNYVLGSVGKTLLRLGRKWKSVFPRSRPLSSTPRPGCRAPAGAGSWGESDC